MPATTEAMSTSACAALHSTALGAIAGHHCHGTLVGLGYSLRTDAMEDPIPSMTRMFDQLGLPSQPPAIEAFIAAHKPLDPAIALCDAPFWTASQAEFLRAEMNGDADWAIVIERLNSALRSRTASG
jgi:hypothetical protein